LVRIVFFAFQLGYMLTQGAVPTAYNVLASAPSPYGEKNPNLLKSWGIKRVNFCHQNGQFLPAYTMFWHLHHHPTAKKIQIRQNLGASKGSTFAIKMVNFCLHIQCFGICIFRKTLPRPLRWPSATSVPARLLPAGGRGAFG
jgi:hypothetical protein